MDKYWIWISIALILTFVLMSDDVQGAIDPMAWRDDGEWEDPTFGLPSTSLNQGFPAGVVTGGLGNDWGGSMSRALWFGKTANDFIGRYTITSTKRTWGMTTSDHNSMNLTSYAVDISTSGEEGDMILKHLMERFGSTYQGGYWYNVNRGGYRYQFGWKEDQDHYDHIHIGVRKLS